MMKRWLQPWLNLVNLQPANSFFFFLELTCMKLTFLTFKKKQDQTQLWSSGGVVSDVKKTSERKKSSLGAKNSTKKLLHGVNAQPHH